MLGRRLDQRIIVSAEQWGFCELLVHAENLDRIADELERGIAGGHLDDHAAGAGLFAVQRLIERLDPGDDDAARQRTEARRVGKEWGRTGRSRGAPYHSKKHR